MLLERMVRWIPGIVRFQFLQTAPDALELLVIADSRFNETSMHALGETQRHLKEASGAVVRLTPRVVDDIPLARSGKHRSVVPLRPAQR